jgi:hypothetical protein
MLDREPRGVGPTNAGWVAFTETWKDPADVIIVPRARWLAPRVFCPATFEQCFGKRSAIGRAHDGPLPLAR